MNEHELRDSHLDHEIKIDLRVVCSLLELAADADGALQFQL